MYRQMTLESSLIGMNVGLMLSSRLTGSKCRMQLVTRLISSGALPKLDGTDRLQLMHSNFSNMNVVNATVTLCSMALSPA